MEIDSDLSGVVPTASPYLLGPACGVRGGLVIHLFISSTSSSRSPLDIVLSTTPATELSAHLFAINMANYFDDRFPARLDGKDISCYTSSALESGE